MSKKGIEAEQKHWARMRRQFGQRVLRTKREALGYTQEQMAEKRGVNQSTICRVEQGQRPKDLATLVVLADGYELNQDQIDRWLYLFSGITQPDWETASGIDGDYVSAATRTADPLLEVYTDYINTIHKMRLDGNLALVIEVATGVSRKLEEYASNKQFQRDRPAFLRLLAELLNCQGLTYSDITVGDELWAAKTGFAAKLQHLGRKFNFDTFLGLADEFWGDSYFVVGQFARASHYLEAALSRVENVEHKFTTLTTMAKVLAFSKDRQRFEVKRLEITRLVEEGHMTNLESIAFAYGSLARSYASLGLGKEALQYLELEKTLVSQMENKNSRVLVRPAQAIRDEIAVIKQIDPTGHLRYLERQTEEAIGLAKQCGCQRLMIQLQNRLEEISM